MEPRQNQSPRGFSLVELVFVTAVMAITAAIVLPHWSNSVRNYQLTLAARRVAADLSWAQSQADAISTSVTVTFDVQGGKYQLSVKDPDRPSQAYSVDLTADPYRVTVSSASFGGGAILTYNGFGVPSQGGSVVLSAGSTQRTVTVDASTGQISIQ